MIIKMILTNSFSPDVRVFKEAKYLTSKGHDVEIICWAKTPQKGLPKEEKIENVKVRRFGIPSVEGTGWKQIGAYKSYIGECKKYLKNITYDILHCHDMDGAIVGYLCRKKFIFDMHEFYDKGNKVRKFVSHVIVRHLSKKSIANIYVSNQNLKVYGKGLESKFFVLKNYVDASMFDGCEKTESEHLRVSYIGRVRNQIPEFAALFEAVKDLDDVEVNIYGDGPDLKKLTSMAEGKNNIVVHGGFNGAYESKRIYNNTDVSFIAYDPSNPNYQGDFEPVKFYEAIFTKTPIIATESLKLGKYVSTKNIGIAVDTRSEEKIREAIISFRDNSDFRKQAKENMEKLAGKYDWGNAVKILDEIYDRV